MNTGQEHSLPGGVVTTRRPPDQAGTVQVDTWMRRTQVWATLSVAVAGILGNKARTTLTLLGIVIGVASVITAVGIGTGSAAQVAAQINSLGTNLVTVEPGSATVNGVQGSAGSAPTLTNADVAALRAQANPNGALPDVTSVAPEADTQVQAVAGKYNVSVQADGVGPEMMAARNYQPAMGRFITQADVQRSAQVCALGPTLAATLFPNGFNNVIGSIIQLNGQPFQVVGIMTPKGGYAGVDNDVFVPITAVQNRLAQQIGATSTVSVINFVATQQSTTGAAQAEAGTLLRRLHRLPVTTPDDFMFFSQTSVQQAATGVTDTLTFLLAAVSAVSLLVGGIGIMNIMLVTVTERTREIGLRKAVGARWRDILAQFLVEATIISAVGGLIGVALSYGLAAILPALTAGTTPVLISTGSVLMAVGVSLAIGLFFGSYPASRAAALDPIQALRHE